MPNSIKKYRSKKSVKEYHEMLMGGASLEEALHVIFAISNKCVPFKQQKQEMKSVEEPSVVYLKVAQ